MSLRAGQIIANEAEPQTAADGARTISLGQHNWEIIRDRVTDIIEVSERHIRDGLRLLFQFANLKAEPTGALSLGAVLEKPQQFQGCAVCCVVSGGNVDPQVYSAILNDE
jgi:threonine dehydratase